MPSTTTYGEYEVAGIEGCWVELHKKVWIDDCPRIYGGDDEDMKAVVY